MIHLRFGDLFAYLVTAAGFGFVIGWVATPVRPIITPPALDTVVIVLTQTDTLFTFKIDSLCQLQGGDDAWAPVAHLEARVDSLRLR